jgi:hypothetical protein
MLPYVNHPEFSENLKRKCYFFLNETRHPKSLGWIQAVWVVIGYKSKAFKRGLPKLKLGMSFFEAFSGTAV